MFPCGLCILSLHQRIQDFLSFERWGVDFTFQPYTLNDSPQQWPAFPSLDNVGLGFRVEFFGQHYPSLDNESLGFRVEFFGQHYCSLDNESLGFRVEVFGQHYPSLDNESLGFRVEFFGQHSLIRMFCRIWTVLGLLHEIYRFGWF